MGEQVLPAASFSQAWASFWENVFNFRGMATRAEYWWMVLVSTAATLVVSFIPLIGTLASLAFAVLTIALFVRRFHDAGFSTAVAVWVLVTQVVVWGVSGTAILLAWLVGISGGDATLAGGLLILGVLVAVVGFSVLVFSFVVTLLPSRPGNRYGPQRAGRVLVPLAPAAGAPSAPHVSPEPPPSRPPSPLVRDPEGPPAPSAPPGFPTV